MPTLGRTQNIQRQQTRTNFRFAKNKIHLTYKFHLNVEQLVSTFGNLGNGIKWWSIAHERGSHTPDESVGGEPGQDYEHTHFAVEWKRRLDTCDPRYFDIIATPTDTGIYNVRRSVGHTPADGEHNVHPHLQQINGDAHSARIFDEYHHKEGVPFQSETRPGQTVNATIIERIRNASSLAEACDIAGKQKKKIQKNI